MSKSMKKTILKKENSEKNKIEETKEVNSFYVPLVEKKLVFFAQVIEKTILHIQRNKFLDILGISDIGTCVEKLGEISKKIEEITSTKMENYMLINHLQTINNDLSSVLKSYGTENLDDLLLICFGNNNKIVTSEEEEEKFKILKKYFHPTSYKLINKREENKINSDTSSNMNFSCSDISASYKQFHMKVYGIKLFIYNSSLKKTLVVFGIIDDISVDFLHDKYIKDKKNIIKNNYTFQGPDFDLFVSSLILKDYLIYESEHDIYTKFVGYISHNNRNIQKPVSQLVKEFIADDMYIKRNTLINLLVFSSNYENQYLAYLLYDLLSNDTNGTIDTQEQTILFDSFPWSIKVLFKQSMKKTIQYTNELSNFDMNKIPLEQQICLLKASDSVKEKAMMKLKEVKAKSEDSGSKARQFLDGLLKIPFSIYKREPILNVMDKARNQFKEMHKKYKTNAQISDIPYKEQYTSIEMVKYLKKIDYKENLTSKNLTSENLTSKNLTSENLTSEKIKEILLNNNKKILKNHIENINILLKKYKKNDKIIKYSHLNKSELKDEIKKIIEFIDVNSELHEEFMQIFLKEDENSELNDEIKSIQSNIKEVSDYMNQVKMTLDKAVHGHEKAKKQVERIIGQWINGQQDGYCFGFEGAPGIGKTSLAKRGISDCLKDDDGISRPFAMIQMGGDSNGSTLHGHNYTYVGSTWGSIVQILIDKKCMNPIIFIDEVDKISRTEHGKEIVGILTHLLDPAQNDCFQDKYFNGIDLDLSKALFILSYNDPDAIDKILLDRVHRIKFNSLTLEDKIVISKRHILPDIYKKMGLEDMIQISDETLKFIIDEYTLESGVRKLKEILFEIVGEINLNVLKNNINDSDEIPILINIDDIKNKYFKDKREIMIRKVPSENLVGFANGMYATSLGNGGTLPIHAKYYPSEHFLELKLTGLQQDVMKESMHISLTIAWNLTSEEKRNEVRQLYDGKENKYGINIHPGDGSVHKDGPSAGITITSVIYSLLNNIPIKAGIAMTGEIQMSGEISAIGGLNLKIIGSIKAGINTFIYPKENKKDFDEFYEKYKNSDMLNGIQFHSVENISQVLELILEK